MKKRDKAEVVKGPFEMTRDGDVLQKILERHAGTADCRTVSAILGISDDALPEATYCLLHFPDHEGKSAVPDLCSDGLRGLFELIIACGIEVGMRLTREGSHRWTN